MYYREEIFEIDWDALGILIILIVVIGALFYDEYVTTPELERVKVKEAAVWVAAGCPVYKSSCGSKSSTYVCERKAAIVGRNQVGDTFVEAYPICRK